MSVSTGIGQESPKLPNSSNTTLTIKFSEVLWKGLYILLNKWPNNICNGVIFDFCQKVNRIWMNFKSMVYNFLFRVICENASWTNEVLQFIKWVNIPRIFLTFHLQKREENSLELQQLWTFRAWKIAKEFLPSRNRVFGGGILHTGLESPVASRSSPLRISHKLFFFYTLAQSPA